MVKKILPPIDDKNQIANLASAGEWKSEDASFKKLAKGLKLGSHEECFFRHKLCSWISGQVF